MIEKNLEDFSSLFDLTPQISILDINNNFHAITNKLEDIVLPHDGVVTTLENLPLNQLKIKAKRSSYDYVIISNTFLNQENISTFMKIISVTLRDSGYIIILEDKEKDLDRVYDLLEEFDYGAVSSIDIFTQYNLVMGKKLHMWGMD